MVVRRILILFAILAAGVTFAALKYIEKQKSTQRAIDDRKFVSTYVELAVADELYRFNPDSIAVVTDRIYSKNDTDSTWMTDYLDGINGDTERYERVWQGIIDALDSLRQKPAYDSTSIF